MDTPPTLTQRAAETGRALLAPRPVRYGLIAFAALFLVFGLAGYLWLPGFAKAKLEALLSQEFDRPVRVERVEVSPYALSATLRGFAVGRERLSQGAREPKAGQELLAFDSLYLRISPLSLARGIPVVAALRLEGPRLRLARVAEDRLDVSDLLDKWLSGPSSPTPEFSVSNIVLEKGAVSFEDRVQGAEHSVTDISLAVPFIANTSGAVDSDVLPRFSAVVDGAALSLGGAVRPFSPGQDASVELSIKDFDLMRVYRYAPPGLPARLDSARLDAQLKLSFARPKGQEPQLRLSGQAALRELSLLRGAARLRLGALTLRLAEASLAGGVSAGLGLENLTLAAEGAKEPSLGLAALEATGIKASLKERRASVDELRLQRPFASIRRLAGGQLDLQALLAAPAGKAETAKPAAKPDPKPAAKPDTAKPAEKPAAKAEPAWAWKLGRLLVEDGGARYADETLPGVRPLTVSALALELAGLSSAAEAARLSLSARLNEQGGAKAAGTVQLAPLKAELDLDLSQLDLVALQGWATEDLNAVLTKGDLSLKGRFSLAGEDAAFAGELGLFGVNVLDKLNSADILRWRSLKIAGIKAGSAPVRLAVDEVALAGFFARLLLTPEGHLNLQDVLKKDQGGAQANATSNATSAELAAANATAPAEPAKPAPQQAEARPAKAAPAPAVRIGRILLNGGGINFTDRFIKPNYTANLTDLSGRIGLLAAGTPTELAIKGKVDRTAPLEIAGRMDPLATPMSLDIMAKATGVEMSTFSPYSGRYVGYEIEKGKLSVDVRYLVDKGALSAENHVFLDQLTLGRKVDSPSVLSIPVGLVLALLKNSRGEIDINLPIKGSLSDPEFSLGGVIGKVILNLLVKAATSPFSLLASLFGGGEELSYVAFEPGRSVVDEAAQKHLETLAKALRDRTGLKLELSGHADPEAEKEGLKRAMLDRRVRAVKAEDLARKGKASGSLAEVTVGAEEYPRYLERVYKAADIKKPRNLIGLPKSLPVEQMEALLLASLEPGPDDLARLAKDRGVAVQAWLVDKGGIEQGRVFLLAPKVGGETSKGAPAGGRVDFTLR